jgi:nucleoside-diphosphate-sugar epimerase
MEGNILVMGALGQIGSELTAELRRMHGIERVIASDIRIPQYDPANDGIYEIHDCTHIEQTFEVVKKHDIRVIYNLPSLLSATAEQFPQKAFEVNLIGLYNTLEVARQFACSVFTPSTIGAFGASTPKDQTPQETIMRPLTMYGVTKVSGELLSDYYHFKYGVDTRGVRYPGVISHKTFPGGGTTDYAVEIFYAALKGEKYISYLRSDTILDMMYMPDAINAAIDVMEAAPKKLRYRNAYNVTSMSLTVDMLALEIQKHLPDFKYEVKVDPLRQGIADSWPNGMDDSAARKDWNWVPKYNLEMVVKVMLNKLKLY